MQIDNIVEFKISENLVDYDSAIEFMNSHINKMKKNQEPLRGSCHDSGICSFRRKQRNGATIERGELVRGAHVTCT